MGGGASTETGPASGANSAAAAAAAGDGPSFSDIRDKDDEQSHAQGEASPGDNGDDDDGDNDDDDDDGFAEMAAMAQAEAQKQRATLAQLPPTTAKQETKLLQMQMQLSLRDVSITCFYLEEGDVAARLGGDEKGRGRLRVEAVVTDTDERFETTSEVTLAREGTKEEAEALVRRGLGFDNQTGELELHVFEEEEEEEEKEKEKEEEKAEEEERRKNVADVKEEVTEKADGKEAPVLGVTTAEAGGKEEQGGGFTMVDDKGDQAKVTPPSRGDDADSISDFSDSDQEDRDVGEEEGARDDKVSVAGEEKGPEAGENTDGENLWQGGNRVRFGRVTHHCMIAMVHRKETRTIVVHVHDIEMEGTRHEVEIAEAAFFGRDRRGVDGNETIDLRECAQRVVNGLVLDSGGGGLRFHADEDGATASSASGKHGVADGLIFQAGRLIRKVHYIVTVHEDKHNTLCIKAFDPKSGLHGILEPWEDRKVAKAVGKRKKQLIRDRMEGLDISRKADELMLTVA